MGDVEEMIGELEEDEEEEPEEGSKEKKADEEETFGLDLDEAWNSPDREAD